MITAKLQFRHGMPAWDSLSVWIAKLICLLLLLAIDTDEGGNGISSVKLSNYILVGRHLVAWK